MKLLAIFSQKGSAASFMIGQGEAPWSTCSLASLGFNSLRI